MLRKHYVVLGMELGSAACQEAPSPLCYVPACVYNYCSQEVGLYEGSGLP